jgi:hypothetical protein
LTNRLLLLTMAVTAAGAGDLRAQGVLQPGEAAPDDRSGSVQGSFPVTGAAPIAGVMMAASLRAGGAQDQCTTDFQPLRDEAERRGKLIKAASDRHATANEACSLIGNFAQAEIKMIKFVEAHATQCGFPMQVADQLKNGHKNTEDMQKKVCTIAQQGSPKRGPVGDFPPW